MKTKPRMKQTRHDVRMTCPGEFVDAVHDLAAKNGWSKKQQLRYFAQSGMFLVDQSYLRRSLWYYRFWEKMVVRFGDISKQVMRDMDFEGAPGLIEALMGSAVVEHG